VVRTPNIVEDRREQIMDAALRLFAQKGFTRATNRETAREARSNKASRRVLQGENGKRRIATRKHEPVGSAGHGQRDEPGGFSTTLVRSGTATRSRR
jgi:hypothetical protein